MLILQLAEHALEPVDEYAAVGDEFAVAIACRDTLEELGEDAALPVTGGMWG